MVFADGNSTKWPLEMHQTLLFFLSSFFKNVAVVIWGGGGIQGIGLDEADSSQSLYRRSLS